MKQPVWTQKYTVNTFLVNPQKKLGLYGLLNLIQDTAWIHATHLGHGHEEMMKEETAWVLTRQRLTMDEWPHWGDEIELITWVRPITSMVAVRDFEIKSKGRLIGECTTQWLILDLKTRRPSERKLSMDPAEFHLPPKKMQDASKIMPPKDFSELARFQVRNSDLDLNGHVNNTRYAQWILDSIHLSKHQQFNLRDYEVNFLAETWAGDEIIICTSSGSDSEFYFQGIRTTDKKKVFAASLKVSAGQLAP